MPPRPSAPRSSLNARHWAEAALDAIAESGLAAVAVEPLARRLKVTKGSFYWHFENREALLRAALDLWEQQQYAMELELTPQMDTGERLFALLRRIANIDPRSERVLMVLTATEHPLARAAARRVSLRWRALARHCYAEIADDEAEAERWAAFAYSTYIGVLHLRRSDPSALPSGQEFSGFVRFMIRHMLPRPQSGAAA